jgi:hypothetical protein
MVHVNSILWLAMVGALFAPIPDQTARWIAVAGLAAAALWEHAAVRGLIKAKKSTHDATAAS